MTRRSGANLNRVALIADDATARVVDWHRGPVAAGPIHRLSVALVGHVALRSRRDDGTCDNGTADDAGGNAGAPAPAATAAAPALRIRIRCRHGQRPGDGRGRK